MSKLIYTAGLATAAILLAILIAGQQYDSWLVNDTATQSPTAANLADGSGSPAATTASSSDALPPDASPPTETVQPATGQSATGQREGSSSTATKSHLTSSEVVLSGIVEPVREARIRAAVDGRLQSVSVQEGDEIKSGQVVAKIADEQLEQDLEKLQATSRGVAHSIEATKAMYEAAAARVKMVENLKDKRVISEAAKRELKAKARSEAQKVAQLEDDHTAAEKAISVARAKLADYVITAPFDGRITHVDGFANQFVAQGDVVAIIESHQKQLRVFVHTDFLKHLNSLQCLAQLPQGAVELTVQSVVRDARADGQHAVIMTFQGASWPWTGEILEVKCRPQPKAIEHP